MSQNEIHLFFSTSLAVVYFDEWFMVLKITPSSIIKMLRDSFLELLDK